MSDANDDASEDGNLFNAWWGKLLGGTVFWGLGIWLFYELGKLEVEGGRLRIHWLIAVVYNLGGRWGAVGLCALLGTLLLGHGLYQFSTAAKKPSPAEPPRSEE